VSPRASLRTAAANLLGRSTENLLDPTVPVWCVLDDLSGARSDDGAASAQGRRAPVLAVGVVEHGDAVVVAGESASAALRDLGLDAAELVAAHTPSASAGSVSTVPLVSSAKDGFGRVLLAGLGKGSADDVRTAAAAVGRLVRDVETLVVGFGAGAEGALVEGVTLGSWSAPASVRSVHR